MFNSNKPYTAKPTKQELSSFYQRELRRLITNPRVSPMQAINIYCDFICPNHAGECRDCRNLTCPLGIVKQKMDIASDGNGKFVDTNLDLYDLGE
jgi:hypothetical protein